MLKKGTSYLINVKYILIFRWNFLMFECFVSSHSISIFNDQLTWNLRTVSENTYNH